MSEKEANESHFCVVSLRMKMGRVAEAPREEPWEERGDLMLRCRRESVKEKRGE
jgi:hypothetical protein